MSADLAFFFYPRASVFYKNEIGIKVAEASINVRMNKLALSERVCKAYEVALQYWYISLVSRASFQNEKASIEVRDCREMSCGKRA